MRTGSPGNEVVVVVVVVGVGVVVVVGCWLLLLNIINSKQIIIVEVGDQPRSIFICNLQMILICMPRSFGKTIARQRGSFVVGPPAGQILMLISISSVTRDFTQNRSKSRYQFWQIVSKSWVVASVTAPIADTIAGLC